MNGRSAKERLGKTDLWLSSSCEVGLSLANILPGGEVHVEVDSPEVASRYPLEPIGVHSWHQVDLGREAWKATEVCLGYYLRCVEETSDPVLYPVVAGQVLGQGCGPGVAWRHGHSRDSPKTISLPTLSSPCMFATYFTMGLQNVVRTSGQLTFNCTTIAQPKP